MRIQWRLRCEPETPTASSGHAPAPQQRRPMSQTTKSHARIQALDERLSRLRAERIRLAARVSQSERRRDTRRKILIGAAVLAAIERDGLPALDSQHALPQWLDDRLTRPHDRAVFDLAKRDPRA